MNVVIIEMYTLSSTHILECSWLKQASVVSLWMGLSNINDNVGLHQLTVSGSRELVIW